MALLSSACAYNITELERGCASRPGGWCAPAEQVAGASWEYAQLAQNAYWQGALESDRERDRQYVLAPQMKERFASADDARGYAYSVFDRYETGVKGQENLVEVVLVFRGTEGPKDWWYGNILGAQGKRGLVTYRQLRNGMDEAGYPHVPISLVGHSLGGRIADRVLEELAEDGEAPSELSAWLFNTTRIGPRLRRGVDPDGFSERGTRVAISEKGEIAGLLRFKNNGAEWDGYEIDCRPGLDLIGGHYMRPLADCLTWIAARDDALAARSVEANEITAPEAEERPIEEVPASTPE